MATPISVSDTRKLISIAKEAGTIILSINDAITKHAEKGWCGPLTIPAKYPYQESMRAYIVEVYSNFGWIIDRLQPDQLTFNLPEKFPRGGSEDL